MKYFIVFFFVLYSTFALSLAAPKSSDIITVAVSPSLPPYVFSEDDTGLQLQILKSAFKDQGITNLDIVYMSNKRAGQSLEQMKVDIAMNYAGLTTSAIYPSQSLLAYQNVAISLRKNNFKINTVYDLLGKSVVAFQNATEFLPPPFKALTTKLSAYEEVVYQAAQVDHLMKEWVDVVVLEKRVFLYYLQQYKESHPIKPITVHPIFPEAPRPAYFNSKVLQEIFDMGLAHIIENGQYSKIMAFDGSDYAQVVEPSSIK
ncbi:MAG: polar amino acid transport system substrate-binding protein [Pseudoalteromonas rhizosphaerae]|jgi:polar amino acid transport system substrate-binding protein|uniref:Transporter substrate-binding domain-containing protein n=1 Tax=Pseudoalteromonas neustonica TaxID=1840331 RepID=A0ABY3FFV2_9GAMM|nr:MULTISPECIES: transporter substrate-binding domain-containing protein [Pseudoalteromonas]MBB1294250.1 transporter substrate-binding domain-containing protein [Pseudoalteromonas sp. SR41-4]MBB1303539.1 transporter substrate-binding domain-containing protein [Pseudoalteromonas sp. SR44-8]MBB1311526.1 transporter substrate-binding domain-containing protein [Pseudoalteromonas sp. SR41-8]MBB1396347.1 transporter substrate-binding domain-containing protein [Pseudoalteromonas sp. SG44-8]MBB1411462|tara:strand:- start:3613 stop:4389 length:777 start_codon:yes stop_codon:yes gene_type:complete